MQAGLMANTKPLTFHDGLYGKLVQRRRDVFRKLGFFFSSLKQERTETQRKVLQSLKHHGSSSVIRHVFESLTRRHNPILSRIFRLVLQSNKLALMEIVTGPCCCCSRVHRWDTFASQRHRLLRPCLQHLKYLIPLNIL